MVGLVAVAVAFFGLRLGRRALPAGRGARAAERLAELLLLEIQLCHAEELEAARREQRILSTFGKDIARARVMFEARFPRGSDGWLAFDQGVLRLLAGGDPRALGSRSRSPKTSADG
jgi:hypothetical protein